MFSVKRGLIFSILIRRSPISCCAPRGAKSLISSIKTILATSGIGPSRIMPLIFDLVDVIGRRLGQRRPGANCGTLRCELLPALCILPTEECRRAIPRIRNCASRLSLRKNPAVGLCMTRGIVRRVVAVSPQAMAIGGGLTFATFRGASSCSWTVTSSPNARRNGTGPARLG